KKLEQQVVLTPKSVSKIKPATENVFSVKRILLPVDFSPAGKQSFHDARALAELNGAIIYLIHVVEPISNDIIPGIDNRGNIIRENLIREMEKLQVGFFKQVRTCMLLRNGIPFNEIVAAAEQENADLIIMSTHGYTGFKHVLLGSTTERVVQHAKCSVLVVRSKPTKKRK
ncbi:MAG: universal stress protein, partial [Chthoniobacterales bacterium]